jgi:SAM-dependent methyltransferase
MAQDVKGFKMSSNQPYDQQKIWAYFQSHSLRSFEGARPRLDYIAKWVMSSKRRAGIDHPTVLNIGVGNGYLERTLQARGAVISVLDPDGTALERLREEAISTHQGFIEALPFNDGCFDVVVVSEVLEHLRDPQREAGLSEIARVLKSGGVLIGTVPFREDLLDNMVVCPDCGAVFHRWGHYKSFDSGSLRAEIERNLSIDVVRPMAFVAFRGRSLAGKIKSLIRMVLGRFGIAIAEPSMFFVGTKQPSDS